jgi:F0F1-type ATP synthase assembly protein I
MAYRVRLVPPTGTDANCFDDLVNAALTSPSTPAADAALLAARRALGHWDAAGLAALRAHLVRTGDADARALTRVLRASGASLRPEPKPSATEELARQRAGESAEDARERRREELRARAAHREYAQLTASVRREEMDAKKTDTFSTYRQQLSLGMSALLGLFSAAVAGYYFGRILFGRDDSRAWMMSLGFGIVLLLVEMGLLVIQLSRADSHVHAAAAARKRE